MKVVKPKPRDHHSGGAWHCVVCQNPIIWEPIQDKPDSKCNQCHEAANDCAAWAAQ